jgi:hypothetical protein
MPLFLQAYPFLFRTTHKVLAATLIATDFCLLASVAVQAQPSPNRNLVFVGIVRNDTGRLYRFNGLAGSYAGYAKWETCPQNTSLVGTDFQSNGFWLCASPNLANRGTWYFGNVVNDKGYYWELYQGSAKAVGYAKWDTCWEGTLGARSFHSNGFWFCVP